MVNAGKTTPKSRLVLGTVQLGMVYGLNNTHGQPEKEEAFSILDAAWGHGINTFDTAYAYGSAEKVLGEWITFRSLTEDIHVVSKMRPHILEAFRDDPNVIGKDLRKSLKDLNLERLDGYLLHSPGDITSEVVTHLKSFKEDALVRNIGASTYTETEAVKALDMGIDYIQIPYNVLDQRLDKTDFFEIAKKNNVEVFARSPFLQGLLLMEPDEVPAHLSAARTYVVKFREIAARYHLSPLEAALLFVSAHSGINHIVFGVDTLPQLEEICAAASHAVPDGMVKEIRNSFADIPETVINPSLWNRKN